MNGINRLHQLTTQSGSQMMSYVIETDDDRLIVVDGGMTADADYLLRYIRDLNGGRAHVDCWLLTHVHSDHINALIKLLNDKPEDLVIDRLYYNFPPVEKTRIYEPSDAHTGDEFNAVLPSLEGIASVFEDGQVIKVGSASFTVLFTPDPDYSITENFVNNTSTVFRMTLGGSSVLFLGDLGVEAGEVMLARHGGGLKSDYVQMAHHGQNGVTKAVYAAAAPSACLWDTPLWLWNNDAGKGYNTHIWKTITVRSWMAELGVRKHYVIKDGTHVIDL